MIILLFKTISFLTDFALIHTELTNLDDLIHLELTSGIAVISCIVHYLFEISQSHTALGIDHA